MILYDPVRKKHVVSTPEEQVRQRVLRQMIHGLGYPRSLIAIEKDVAALACVPDWANPQRRIDIVCFTPDLDGLRPLLLVECKFEICKQKASNQMFGYNRLIGAPFLALADAKGIETFWFEKENLASVPFLPSYTQLVNSK